MSFATLVISRTQHTKSSQNGRNPRLASLGQGGRPPTVPFHHATHRRWSSARHQAKIKCSTQVQSIKTERHEPSPFGSTISDKLLDQDPNRLEQQHKTPDQCDTTTEGRDVPEPGRPAYVRPAGLGSTWKLPEQLTTDSRRQSKPSRVGRRQMARSLGQPA